MIRSTSKCLLRDSSFGSHCGSFGEDSTRESSLDALTFAFSVSRLFLAITRTPHTVSTLYSLCSQDSDRQKLTKACFFARRGYFAWGCFHLFEFISAAGVPRADRPAP